MENPRNMERNEWIVERAKGEMIFKRRTGSNVSDDES